VEVENDIAAPGDLDPDQIQTPGIYVDRIVRIPEDGIWPEVAGGPSGTGRTFA
jgi:hypothetical protein